MVVSALSPRKVSRRSARMFSECAPQFPETKAFE
jgi:hypothetical protein